MAGNATSSIRIFVRDGIIQTAYPLLGCRMSDLLEQFIAQECTPYVRRLLEDAIADSRVVRPHFEFNRFEVTIEREGNIVVLEDVLDATDVGVRRVPLGEFMAALKQCPG